MLAGVSTAGAVRCLREKGETRQQSPPSVTNLESVNESSSIVISADFDAPTEEHILFNVLDEFIFSFMTRNYFIVRRVEFSKLDKTGFEARAFGEEMNIDKHERGTEIKAITMHGMSVVHSDNQPRTDTRFLLDI